MKKNKYKPEIIAAASALMTLAIFGTVSYHFLEGWSWIKSLYFVVATLFTVGYGDVHPTSEFSRLFTVFFILFGATIAIASIAIIGSRYLDKRERKMMEKTNRKN